MQDQVYTITGTVLTIWLPEEVDHHVAEGMRVEMEQLMRRRNIRSVLFDFSRTEFMDSSGAGMILRLYKTMRFLGGRVAAVHVCGQTRRILEMSGIDRVIDVYEEGAEPCGKMR